MVILFFLPKLFSISLHHFQTHVQKRNYSLSLKFIIFICLKNKKIYFQIILMQIINTYPKKKKKEPLSMHMQRECLEGNYI